MWTNYLYTIAGAGPQGSSGDGGPATSATFFNIEGLYVDAGGNIYIVDTAVDRIRMVPKQSGTYFGQAMVARNVYTIAGNGVRGFSGDGGPATAASMFGPSDVSVDPAGNLYIGDQQNRRVRKVSPSGIISTVVGNGSVAPIVDGSSAASASVTPFDIATDSLGNLLVVSDSTIWMVPATGGTFYNRPMAAATINLVAGTGLSGSSGDGGPAAGSALNLVSGLALDSGNNIVLGERNGNRVRMVPRSGGSYFGQSMVTGGIYSIAGTGLAGFSGDGGPAASAQVSAVRDVAVDGAGNVYFNDSNNGRVRLIARTAGAHYEHVMSANSIQTIAGNGTLGISGNNVRATCSAIWPNRIAVDSGGNLMVAEFKNSTVRLVPTTTCAP